MTDRWLSVPIEKRPTSTAGLHAFRGHLNYDTRAFDSSRWFFGVQITGV